MAETTPDYSALAQRLRAIHERRRRSVHYHEGSPGRVAHDADQADLLAAASACDALAERRCETCASQDNRYGDEMPWCQNLGVFCSATYDGCNAWSPKGGAK
jgi:hypothetical protein